MRKHSPAFPKLLWGGYIPCRRVEYRGEWWYQSLREVAKRLESGRYEDMAELAEKYGISLGWLWYHHKSHREQAEALKERIKRWLNEEVRWRVPEIENIAAEEINLRKLMDFRRMWLPPVQEYILAEDYTGLTYDVSVNHEETFTVESRDGLPYLTYKFAAEAYVQYYEEEADYCEGEEGKIRIGYECPLWNGLLPEGINYRETWKVKGSVFLMEDEDLYEGIDIDDIADLQASVEIVRGDERIVETLEGPLRLARRADSSPLLEMAKLPEERRRLRLMLTYLLLSSAPLRYAIQKAKAR